MFPTETIKSNNPQISVHFTAQAGRTVDYLSECRVHPYSDRIQPSNYRHRQSDTATRREPQAVDRNS